MSDQGDDAAALDGMGDDAISMNNKVAKSASSSVQRTFSIKIWEKFKN